MFGESEADKPAPRSNLSRSESELDGSTSLLQRDSAVKRITNNTATFQNTIKLKIKLTATININEKRTK